MSDAPRALHFPAKPTDNERERRRLSKARQAELQAMAEGLRACPGDAAVDKVAAAAAASGVQVHVYRRRFGDLANLARWKSRTPEDYLEGRATHRGGARQVAEVDPEEAVWVGGRVKPETKYALHKARQKLGLGLDGFLSAAAAHALARGHFEC